jgi:hypothetical protein
MAKVRVYYPDGETLVVDEAEAQRLRESKLGPQLVFEALVSAPTVSGPAKGLINLMVDAFIAGFEASREGFNGEHCPAEKHDQLVDIAAEKVAEILAAAIRAGAV